MGTTSIVLFVYCCILAGFMLLIGMSKIPQGVRQSWAPEDLEAMQRELDFWRCVGQIVLMMLSFLVMLWLLID
jgi:hypothetical protein